MTEQGERQTGEGQGQAAAASGEPVVPVGEVVAPPDSWYRTKFTIFFLASILGGAWFGYDGWVNWPEQNRKLAVANDNLAAAQKKNDSALIRQYTEERDKYAHHDDMSIRLQKILCVALPLVGLAVFARVMRNSRGELRLDGTTLHVPGHPPVRLDSVTKIDKKLWDRKGIAYLDYEQDGQSGRVKLDDFAYKREPTDEIFKRIENYLTPAGEGATSGEGGSEGA